MNPSRPLILSIACALTWVSTATGAEPFTPLFNGRDLRGWTNVNCAPETWSVKDGMIHCTGHPTGALRTTRHYENFILELEWRHLTSGGNSGIFIWGSPIAAPGVPFLRGIEVQVLDNGYDHPGKDGWFTTHGDIFPIHGATMTSVGRTNGNRSFPSEKRSRSSPEWNHYRITATNGVLRLSVNGAEVTIGTDCNYRRGYLALESEGAPVQFRNLRIQELAPTPAPSSMTAPLENDWRSLFTGLDFRGWVTNEAVLKRWQAGDNQIRLKPGGTDTRSALWHQNWFQNAEFVFDVRQSANNSDSTPTSLLIRSKDGQEVTVAFAAGKPGSYGRHRLLLQDGKAQLLQGEEKPQWISLPVSGDGTFQIGLSDGGQPADFTNLYSRTAGRR